MFRNLGLALKVLRELKGVSQVGLARQAGIGKSQLSKYENGKGVPTLDSLERVLAALGAQPLALFYLVDFLERIEYQESCEVLLMDANFGPGLEQQAFARLIQDVLLLFKSQVERRIRGVV